MKFEPKKICIVVDGYSSGNLYPAEIQKRGYSVFHVRSTPDIWPILLPTFRPTDYEKEFIFNGNLESLISELQPYHPICVFAGTETGVELADRISEALGLATNGSEFTKARRNKYMMIEAVRAHGLKAADQVKSKNVNEVLAWFKKGRHRKVVVKPLESAGADSVAICKNESEIKVACEAILGKTNQLGISNNEVLCQEFLEGTEYAIDSVTREGRTHVTAIWQYYKVAVNGGDFVYDRDELVPCTDEVGLKLSQYVKDVLVALKVRYGPSHAEVMMTPQGPALVEIGTRLNGTTTPHLNTECVGYSQLDLAVDSYLDPAAFERKAAQPYSLKKRALSVSLISEIEGVVESIPGERLIRNLPSFNELRLRAKPGYELKLTVDYFTTPGFVMLVHSDPQVLQKDLAYIRQLERVGLYELASKFA